MTYPLPSVPLCAGCGHSQAVHLFGVRRGRKTRTSCTHGDPAMPNGQCPCRQFVPPAPEGGVAA